MKGFKKTGNGPKYGSFSFGSKAGFTGSTGRRQEVRTYSRSVPKRKYASGGVVKVADSGSSVTRRDRPVTQFDSEHGGKSPLAPGFNKGGMAGKKGGKSCYAEGGKVGNFGAAIKTVKQLMSQGMSATEAARKAASKHGTSIDKVTKELPKKGMAGDPQLLAGGGLASVLGQASGRVMGRAAPPRIAPGLQAPLGGKSLGRMREQPPGKRPMPAAPPPRPMGVVPTVTTGYGSFGRNPLIGRR